MDLTLGASIRWLRVHLFSRVGTNAEVVTSSLATWKRGGRGRSLANEDARGLAAWRGYLSPPPAQSCY